MDKDEKKEIKELTGLKGVLEDINKLLDDPSFPDPVKDVLGKVAEQLQIQSKEIGDISKKTSDAIKSQLEEIKGGNEDVLREWRETLDRVAEESKAADNIEVKNPNFLKIVNALDVQKGLVGEVLKLLGKLRAGGLDTKVKNKNPTDYISVRLSDGKNFYKALGGGGASGGGGGPSFKLDNGTYGDYRGDDDGNQRVNLDQVLERDFHSVAISTNTSGDTELVAPVVGKKIRVWAYNFNVAGTVLVKFKSGATDKTGAYTLEAREGLSANGGIVPLFETEVNQALNINLSAAIYAYGLVSYTLV